MSSRIRMYLTICLKMWCMWPILDRGCDIHTEALTLYTCPPRIQHWPLTFSDTALCGQSPDCNRQVWLGPGTHVPQWLLEWFPEAFCCSPFSTPPLASSTCLELPWILHSAASFRLTVDSVIEPKRGACSHCPRTCRRSGENFLQVRKRKKRRRRRRKETLTLPIFHFLFIYTTHPLCAHYVPGIMLGIALVA